MNAKNEGGTSVYSSVWSFTTIISAPNTPNLLSPADKTTNISTLTTFIWSAAVNASFYRLQVSQDSTFTSTVFDDSTITGTSGQVQLMNNTNYFWRILAKNIGGLSSWSDVDSFTTLIAMPITPTLVYPSNNQNNLSIELNLIWNKVNNTDAYSCQIASDSNFSQIMINDTTVVDTTKQIILTTHGEKYYWRVRGKNYAGYGEWSDVWSFTTIVALPSKTVLISPSANIANLPLTNLFVWNKVKYAEKYFIQVATDIDFKNITKSDSLTMDTTKTVEGLGEGELYYWKIQAQNIAGFGPWSEIWSFTTTLSNPDNLVATKDGLTGIKLSWKDNSDGEDGFIIEKKENSEGVFNIIDTVNENINQYYDKGIQQGFTYYYRVKGYTEDVESEYSNETNIVVVGIENEEIPTEYSISQNYPNPFNPSTVFRFGLNLPPNCRQEEKQLYLEKI